MTASKFCVNCIHHERSNSENWCLRKKPVSPITGLTEQKYLFCENERSNDMACGPSGYFFEPRVPMPVVFEGHNKKTKGVSELPDNDWYSFALGAVIIGIVLFVTWWRL